MVHFIDLTKIWKEWMSEAACSLNCDHISLRVILKFCLIIVFSWEKRETNQYFSINTNWHSSPLYWLILQIFLGITVISFCYWSINYNPMWALLCHFLQFFSLFSMYCHLMAYPCVFQNNLFKGCVKKKKTRKQKHNWHFALIVRADKSCKSGWCFFLFLMWIIQMSRR